MKKLILGTVQLGLCYGINNQSGKPDQEISYQMLDYAYDHGVTCLDTAEDYGDSEETIGRFIKNSNKSFDICTKLSAKFDCDSELLYERIKDKIDNSLKRLGVDKIYIYYLHSFLHCKNIELMSVLSRLKDQKVISNLGVSIYEPTELEYILENCADIIDVIQLPLNILDHSRWLKDGLLNRAKSSNIKIYVRSILLQGLIFKDEKDEIISKLHAERYIRFLNVLTEKKETSILSIAHSFINNIDEIDAILIGCETVSQLQRNLELMDEKERLSRTDMRDITDFCSTIDINIIDPRKW